MWSPLQSLEVDLALSEPPKAVSRRAHLDNVLACKPSRSIHSDQTHSVLT